MKKFFRLLSTILLVSLILTGCSGYVLTDNTFSKTQSITETLPHNMSGNTAEIIISQEIDTFSIGLVSDYTGSP